MRLKFVFTLYSKVVSVPPQNQEVESIWKHWKNYQKLFLGFFQKTNHVYWLHQNTLISKSTDINKWFCQIFPPNDSTRVNDHHFSSKTLFYSCCWTEIHNSLMTCSSHLWDLFCLIFSSNISMLDLKLS